MLSAINQPIFQKMYNKSLGIGHARRINSVKNSNNDKGTKYDQDN
jgi:hypothetical protein